MYRDSISFSYMFVNSFACSTNFTILFHCCIKDLWIYFISVSYNIANSSFQVINCDSCIMRIYSSFIFSLIIKNSFIFLSLFTYIPLKTFLNILHLLTLLNTTYVYCIFPNLLNIKFHYFYLQFFYFFFLIHKITPLTTVYILYTICMWLSNFTSYYAKIKIDKTIILVLSISLKYDLLF